MCIALTWLTYQGAVIIARISALNTTYSTSVIAYSFLEELRTSVCKGIYRCATIRVAIEVSTPYQGCFLLRLSLLVFCYRSQIVNLILVAIIGGVKLCTALSPQTIDTMHRVCYA